MQALTRLITGIIISLVAAAPLQAHHSTAVYEKKDKQLTLKGTVKEFQYTNPHIWIQLYVTGENKKTVEWGIEGGSPNFLRRQGWTAKSLQAGDEVTVVIRPLRDGQPGGTLISVTFSDGRKLEDIPPP